jgi:Fe-Mn family superoxide dismutase
VKNLAKAQEKLATVTKDTAGFVVGGLKERELTFTNSVVLHELYFANLGGDGKASGSWDEVSRCYERARKAAQIMKG